MSILTFLFLVFLAVFIYRVVIPVYRVGRTIKRARTEMENVFNSSRYAEEESREQAPKKKIDPNIGEYVDFEDIPDSESARPGAPTTPDNDRRPTVTESQIEDAEWEDL
jgi:hypothetical protein